MDKYFEVFQQGFVDKSLSDEELINSVNNLDFEQKMYFNALCLKTFGNSSFDSIYGAIDFRNWHSDFDKRANLAKELTEEQKQNAISWKSFPSKHEPGSRWNYHSKRIDLTSDIIRPLSIKVEVSAVSTEDADKVWNAVAPYLFSHEKDICFKVPNESYFTENLDGVERGNLITIYTVSDEQAFTILKDLDKLLSGIDVQKYTDDAYLDVGNSGVLSAVVDRTPYEGVYIPRTSDDGEVGRLDRPDTFAYLKNVLNEQGLLTEQNLNSIYEKEKRLKFGDFISEREKFTPEAIDEIIETHGSHAVSYAIGHYNCTAEDLKIILGPDADLTDMRGITSAYFNFDSKDVIDAAIGGYYFDEAVDFYINNPQYPEMTEYICSLVTPLCEQQLFENAESIIGFISNQKEREKLGDDVVNNAMYYFLEKVVESGSYDNFMPTFYKISDNQEFVDHIVQALVDKQASGEEVSLPLRYLDINNQNNVNAFATLYANNFFSDKSIEKFMNLRHISNDVKEAVKDIMNECDSQSEEVCYEDAEEEIEL